MAEDAKQALDALQADLTTFQENLIAISQANSKMASVMVDEGFPALSKVQENWLGARADSFIGEANTKMNQLIEDCQSINKALTEIQTAYINTDIRPRLAALGVDQETIDKSFPAITNDTATE